jgi:hypothetical protein
MRGHCREYLRGESIWTGEGERRRYLSGGKGGIDKEEEGEGGEV